MLLMFYQRENQTNLAIKLEHKSGCFYVINKGSNKCDIFKHTTTEFCLILHPVVGLEWFK